MIDNSSKENIHHFLSAKTIETLAHFTQSKSLKKTTDVKNIDSVDQIKEKSKLCEDDVSNSAVTLSDEIKFIQSTLSELVKEEPLATASSDIFQKKVLSLKTPDCKALTDNLSLAKALLGFRNDYRYFEHK